MSTAASLVIFIACFSTAIVSAGETTIAVAANFAKTIQAVGEAFEIKTGHQAKFSFGPTGKLYAQIKNGAPFDAFFSADEARAKVTIEDGIGVEETYFVYAQGKLVLYSWKHPVDTQGLQILQDASFNKLAIANPKTAPYGERAQAYLISQGLYDGVKSKIVLGESIAHAFQFVSTENAEVGFVALSQIVDPESPAYNKGYYWILPDADYPPINQGAIVTQRGLKNEVTLAFIEYMRSPEAADIILRYGYSLPE